MQAKTDLVMDVVPIKAIGQVAATVEILALWELGDTTGLSGPRLRDSPSLPARIALRLLNVQAAPGQVPHLLEITGVVGVNVAGQNPRPGTDAAFAVERWVFRRASAESVVGEFSLM